MVMNLLIGLPGQRPGGLLLTGLYFMAAGSGALVVGFVYAAVGVILPRASLLLQAGSAFLRGIPLLLLVFLLTQIPHLPVEGAGLAALLLYSFSYVGEILRSFLASYPRYLSDQARVIGMGPVRAWFQLCVPWTLCRAWGAVVTHWISLLKDTGALVVLGIGELTTVAKMISEAPGSYERWVMVLVGASLLYLIATLALVQILQIGVGRLWGFMRGGAKTELWNMME